MALEKEIIKVAKTFKSEMPIVKVGKLDGSVEEKLIQELQISGYPTILFFQYNGKRVSTFNGKMFDSCMSVVEWVSKKWL